MLVSKIKPCMSKFTPLYGETANGSLNQLLFLRSYHTTWITAVILELIHANMPGLYCSGGFIRSKPTSSRAVGLMTLDNQPDRMTLRRRQFFQVSDLSSVDGE